MEESPPSPDPGLCAHCAHARILEGRRGARFWRCSAGDEGAGPPRYPQLPVLRCSAHERGGPERETGGARTPLS